MKSIFRAKHNLKKHFGNVRRHVFSLARTRCQKKPIQVTIEKARTCPQLPRSRRRLMQQEKLKTRLTADLKQLICSRRYFLRQANS